MLKSAIPVLHVSDARQSEDFFCNQLGFEREFAYRPDPEQADPCYLGLRRDGVQIHVSSFSGDGVAGTAVYLATDDVDGLFDEFKKKGLAIQLEPTNQTWGNREMYIRDPDGNTIRYCQSGTA